MVLPLLQSKDSFIIHGHPEIQMPGTPCYRAKWSEPPITHPAPYRKTISSPSLKPFHRFEPGVEAYWPAIISMYIYKLPTRLAITKYTGMDRTIKALVVLQTPLCANASFN